MDFNQFSNASSYRLNSGSGNLTNISTVPTQGYAACWTEISADGKSLFVVNTGGPSPYGATVSTFALANNGNLTFKSKTAKASEFTLTDEALTRSGTYLYVVSPLINNPFVNPPPATNGSRIVTFKVGSGGKLNRIGQTTVALAPGVSGLDVH
jgi:6-phosphogluconolactonase (cycloisomerase 2 family)